MGGGGFYSVLMSSTRQLKCRLDSQRILTQRNLATIGMFFRSFGRSPWSHDLLLPFLVSLDSILSPASSLKRSKQDIKNDWLANRSLKAPSWIILPMNLLTFYLKIKDQKLKRMLQRKYKGFFAL